MENNRVSPPRVKGYDKAYELSYELASQKLRETVDLAQQCRNAGAECEIEGEKKNVFLTFLGRVHRIVLPKIEVSVESSSEPVVLRDKLLILHYVNTATGTPLTGRAVTFRELPAGPVYFPTYTKRAIRPFVDAFGKEPTRLLSSGLKLGGRRADLGDASIVIDVFPRVAITYVIWSGDDELPPQGNILYDANVSDYLPTEDITVLTETITWKMVRS